MVGKVLHGFCDFAGVEEVAGGGVEAFWAGAVACATCTFRGTVNVDVCVLCVKCRENSLDRNILLAYFVRNKNI